MNEANQLMARAIVNEQLLELALFNLLCITGDPPRAVESARTRTIESLKYRMRIDGAPIGDPMQIQTLAVQYAREVFDRLAEMIASRPSKN